MPLIEIFEGRTFKQTFDHETEQYILQTQT